MHKSESVLENKTYKILIDFDIEMDHLMSSKRSEIMMINKVKRICRLADFAVPANHRVKIKESE